MKLLATQKRGFMLLTEVFDVLNKLVKSDEDNATGDVQLLCKLFSGERCSYHYSTEESRVIAANTPFSILGSTQIFNAAKLIAKMDQGRGLVDRILFAIPLAFRPTLSEMECAQGQLSTDVVEDLNEYFANIKETTQQLRFHFSDEAQQIIREHNDQFEAEVNEAIREGKVPPKSKLPELVPRIAATLHLFNQVMTELLAGVPATAPPRQIERSILEKVSDLANHLESQKSILCQVSYKQFQSAISYYLSNFGLTANRKHTL